MKKTILITRPRSEAIDLDLFLQNQGFNTIIEPIFDAKIVENSQNFAKNPPQAAILTSSNAIPTFLTCDFHKNIKIFTIGKKTAQKLRENGYENVFFPPKTSTLLLKNLILHEASPKAGKILYFCGNFITFDFGAELMAQGFEAESINAYQVDYKNEFSAEFLSRIKQENIDFVLIFSKNGAKNFHNLTKKHNLLEYFNKSAILCLSNKIADVIKDLGFKISANFDEIMSLKNFYEL